MNQRRRHHDELTRDVEIQLLHQLDRLEVLFRDERDGNVVDVHLMLLDEMNQQVEWAFEVLEVTSIASGDDSNPCVSCVSAITCS